MSSSSVGSAVKKRKKAVKACCTPSEAISAVNNSLASLTLAAMASVVGFGEVSPIKYERRSFCPHLHLPTLLVACSAVELAKG